MRARAKDTHIHTTLLYVFGFKITEILNKRSRNITIITSGRFKNKSGSFHVFNYNEKIIESYQKEQSTRENILTTLSEKQKTIKYYIGSMWYPFIYFDDIKTSLNIMRVVEHKIDDLTIIIDNFGCIFIGVFEPPLNKVLDRALEILNILLSIANLNNIEASLISKEESVYLQDDYYDGNKSIGFTFEVQTIRAKFIPDIAINPLKKYDFQGSNEINTIKTNSIIKFLPQVNKVIYNDEIKSYLTFYLESKTKFLYKDYKSSFLTGWILLEKYIEEMWIKFINDEKFSKKRTKKLTNSLMWSMDYIIESMNMSKIINDDYYKKFMKYKKIRNNIVHEGKASDVNQTKEMLNLIESIMRKKINSL